MISGESVRLRGVEESDIDKFVTWLNDPEVIQNLLIFWPLTMKQEEKWFEELSKREPYEQPLAIEIKTDTGWELVGNSSLQKFDWITRCAEAGIFIGNKAHWGKGFGSEAMKLLLQFGFNRLNLNRIYLHVFETNPRAIRSYEKVGFKHEGRLRQDFYKNGQYIDVLIMGILRSEWENEIR
jgi:RimJ/RimL family protein N-acetyltransferase